MPPVVETVSAHQVKHGVGAGFTLLAYEGRERFVWIPDKKGVNITVQIVYVVSNFLGK